MLLTAIVLVIDVFHINQFNKAPLAIFSLLLIYLIWERPFFLRKTKKKLEKEKRPTTSIEAFVGKNLGKEVKFFYNLKYMKGNIVGYIETKDPNVNIVIVGISNDFGWTNVEQEDVVILLRSSIYKSYWCIPMEKCL